MNAEIVNLDDFRKLRDAVRAAESKTRAELIDEFLAEMVEQENMTRNISEHHARIGRDLDDLGGIA